MEHMTNPLARKDARTYKLRIRTELTPLSSNLRGDLAVIAYILPKFTDCNRFLRYIRYIRYTRDHRYPRIARRRRYRHRGTH